MSDRGVGAVMLLLALAGEAQAQESAELRRLRAAADSAETRYDSANARYRRASSTYDAPRDTMAFTAGRIPLIVAPAVLSTVEVERVQRGITRVLDSLNARFGDEALKLVDTTRWVIRGRSGFLGSAKSVTLHSRSHTEPMRWTLRRPVREADLENFTLRQAGRHLGRAVPALQGYAGGNVSFEPDDSRWEMAARELAISYAGTGRLCSAGDIAHCLRVLRPAEPSGRLDAWFVPADYRAVVNVGRDVITHEDTAGQASWKRCEAGTDSACVRLAHQLPVKDPFSGNLRATFVQHAFDAGGPGMIERMRQDSATGDDLVTLLARAAGVPTDSLVASWQRRATRALHDADAPAFPVVLSTMAWGLVLMGLATRSKPS